MRKIFSVVAVILIILFGVIFWQRERIFSSGLKIPFISREPTVVLAENLEKAGLGLSGLPIISTDTIEASISGIRVFFDTTKDFLPQVRALQLVISRRTIDKIPKEIDLRFNKVVIRY